MTISNPNLNSIHIIVTILEKKYSISWYSYIIKWKDLATFNNLEISYFVSNISRIKFYNYNQAKINIKDIMHKCPSNRKSGIFRQIQPIDKCKYKINPI